MKNGMETPSGEISPSQEAIEEAAYLESSKKIGDNYTALIGRFTGEAMRSDSEVAETGDTLEGKLMQMKQRAEENFKRQHLLVQGGGFDARKILEQVPQFEETLSAADPSQYRMEELSEGMYAVYVKPDLSEKLHGDAQGLAVKIKEGVSFIMLPDYSDGEIAAAQFKENIPHETHHLVWYFSKGDIITNNEKKPDFSDAFSMYQDEVMARLCSDGGLAGYTHLAMLDPTTREQFVKDHPETAEQLTKTTIELNDLLQEIDSIRKQTDIRKQDLIMAVMEAKDFEQMKANLSKAKELIEKQPITKPLPKAVQGGFDSPI